MVVNLKPKYDSDIIGPICSKYDTEMYQSVWVEAELSNDMKEEIINALENKYEGDFINSFIPIEQDNIYLFQIRVSNPNNIDSNHIATIDCNEYSKDNVPTTCWIICECFYVDKEFTWQVLAQGYTCFLKCMPVVWATEFLAYNSRKSLGSTAVLIFPVIVFKMDHYKVRDYNNKDGTAIMVEIKNVSNSGTIKKSELEDAQNEIASKALFLLQELLNDIGGSTVALSENHFKKSQKIIHEILDSSYDDKNKIEGVNILAVTGVDMDMSEVDAVLLNPETKISKA